MIRSIARILLGETSGKVSEAGRQKTLWWNQEVQEKLKDKTKAKKVWDIIRDDISKLAYNTARKQAKGEVPKARNKAYEELYEKLKTKEGGKELFKITKQRNRQSKDVQQVRVIKSKTGEMLMEEDVGVGIGLYQGSTLSSFLFAIIMNKLREVQNFSSFVFVCF